MGRFAGLVLIAGWLLAAGESTPAAEKTTAARPGKARSGPYDSAAVCKKCHTAIHASWSDSAHAHAATTPSFRRSMEETMKLSSDPARTRRDCIECHAPTTRVTGDLDLKNPVSAEGVTCDFCHTVKEVSLERAGRAFTLDPGPVKRGPFAYSRPFPGHRAEYSFLHRGSPLLCAACHEFANEKGFPLLVTYTGWKEGPFPARGIACQDCHMTLIPGKIANDDLGQKQGPRVINRHLLVGGSSMSQLNRGVRLKIESFSATSTVAEVRVAVANEGAGHPIPGGLPTKSLVLVLGAENAGGELENAQETIYRREVLDAKGAKLETLPEMVVRGWKLGRDSRLKPGETRHESFRVNLKGGSRAVVARLEYRDATDTGAPVKTSVITQERRELKAGR
jgi:hypothetical protein